ncbi:MAG TPA: DnaJ domain-containing protein [Thermoanaerobaculia bacterium]|nr:DnaJ domain-containing protein [Thermoanaerobaculia bacterium]
MGELTHYSLLGVGGTADAGEIYSAYSELARLVHPSQAARVGLSGREEALAVLFERATEAYLVLSDPERRGRYHFEVPPPTVVTPVKAEVDPEQAKELARQLFGQARDMVAREEFHYAVELLRRALQLDRRAEYYALLAEVQRKNKNWLRQAADSLREAVLLEPQNTTLRLELADLFEQIGDSQRARSTYRSILVRYPQHAEALEALKRLEKASKREAPPAAAAAAAAEAEPSKEKKGLLGIFRKKKG